jgi:hypothetical protein
MASPICRECGCRIAPGGFLSSDSKLQTIPLCRECLFWANPAGKMADRIEAEVRSGTICHFCFKPLRPPGGTTTRSWDGSRLLRVCFECKDIFEGDD